MTKVNYTEEMVTTITEMYAEKGNAGLAEIGEAVGRPVNSVRAKLIALGKYQKPEPGAKVVKDTGPTKGQMLSTLEDMTNLDVTGATGSTKAFIEAITNFLVEHNIDLREDEQEDDSEAVAS